MSQEVCVSCKTLMKILQKKTLRHNALNKSGLRLKNIKVQYITVQYSTVQYSTSKSLIYAIKAGFFVRVLSALIFYTYWYVYLMFLPLVRGYLDHGYQLSPLAWSLMPTRNSKSSPPFSFRNEHTFLPPFFIIKIQFCDWNQRPDMKQAAEWAEEIIKPS